MLRGRRAGILATDLLCSVRDQMKWRKLITLIGGIAISLPLACYAQQPIAPPKRVGILNIALPCPIRSDNPISRRLAELGWIEGRTFVFECVSAVGHLDQIPALARDLVSRRLDVLMSGNSPAIKELKQETTTIPIVIIGAADPVGYGLVTNLARPEANVTGVAYWGSDMLPKRIELLSEVVPQLRRLAIIGASRDATFIKIIEEGATVAAKRFGFSWQLFQRVLENNYDEIFYDEIFARLAAEHFDAAYIATSAFNMQNSARIVELALHHRIPAIGELATLARAGLLLSYGQDLTRTAARASDYVDKILRGAKPSELPVEQATNLQLVINLKTAETLGLTVPPSLIARADEVIE